MTLDARKAPFAKMNGIGNSILVVDLRGRAALSAEDAVAIGRMDGFAFDQLMALNDPRQPGTATAVDIFNADGSRAGACGNGTRCIAWYLLDGSDADTVTVATEAGPLACRRLGAWEYGVDMGPPRLGWHDIPLRDAIEDTRAFPLEPTSDWIGALGPVSAVSMGNPHAVFWLSPEVPLPDLQHLGPALEHHPMFPERANISFARALSREAIALDVWERGAGVTLACGSAACAALVSGVRTGLSARSAEVHLPGGTLGIEWRESDDHVLMRGPVALERRGELALASASPVE